MPLSTKSNVERIVKEINLLELNIVLDTNIPGRKKVTFDQSMLYQPEKGLSLKNKFPFVSFTKKYPEAKLRAMAKRSYKEVCDLFFNRKAMMFLLKDEEYVEPVATTTRATPSKHLVYDFELVNHNILLTLELIFPTVYPSINNVHSSYDMILETGAGKRKTLVFNPFPPHHYSYLKFGGKTYTVKRSIWLNDCLNHPIYKKYFFENLAKINKNPPDDPDYFNTNTNGYSSNPLIRMGFEEQGLPSTSLKPTLEDVRKYLKVVENWYKRSRTDNALICVGAQLVKRNLKMCAEIYLMIDLFDGEITDKTPRFGLNCKYLGEELGNSLERLLSTSSNPDLDDDATFEEEFEKREQGAEFKHILDKDRYLFSVETGKSVKADSGFVKVDKEKTKHENISEELDEWFSSNIASRMYKDKVTKKTLKDLAVRFASHKMKLNQSEILYLASKNESSNDSLLYLIKHHFEDETNSQQVLDELNSKLLSDIEPQIHIEKDRLDDYDDDDDIYSQRYYEPTEKKLVLLQLKREVIKAMEQYFKDEYELTPNYAKGQKAKKKGINIIKRYIADKRYESEKRRYYSRFRGGKTVKKRGKMIKNTTMRNMPIY